MMTLIPSQNSRTPLRRRAATLATLVAGLAFVALMGCGSDDGDNHDKGTDATSLDGGASDGASGADGAAGSDAGGADGMAEDGMMNDGMTGDGVMTDGGGMDGGGMDGSATDGGATDGGATDGGATDAEVPAPQPFTAYKISIAGVWESNFGGNETITDDAWSTPYGGAKIIKFDNAKGVLYTQNAKDDKYNPSAFNKVLWTAPKQVAVDGFQVGSMYYCTTDFGLGSLALAEASTKTADSTNPSKGGCGNFPWTQLTALETVGEWKTNFGGTEIINRQAWDYAWIRAFENKKNVAYSKNPADAKYNPGKWNKLVWTSPKAGKWYYCTVDFGLDSLDAAKKTTKTADDKDVTGKGCGGFSWTEMTAK